MRVRRCLVAAPCASDAKRGSRCASPAEADAGHIGAGKKRGGRGDSRCGEQVFERGFLWSAKAITSRERAHELLTCSSKALALPFQAFQVSLRAAESESAGADAEATGSNVVVGYEWPFGGELTMRKNTGGKS